MRSWTAASCWAMMCWLDIFLTVVSKTSSPRSRYAFVSIDLERLCFHSRMQIGALGLLLTRRTYPSSPRGQLYSHYSHPLSETYRSVDLLTTMTTESRAWWWLHAPKTQLLHICKWQKVMSRWGQPLRNRDSLCVFYLSSETCEDFPLLPHLFVDMLHIGCRVTFERAQSGLITLRL